MKKIGIIGAMENEVKTLIQMMDIEKTVDKASLKFYIGKLEGKDIVLVQCGIGKVNAALCAQILRVSWIFLRNFTIISGVNSIPGWFPGIFSLMNGTKSAAALFSILSGNTLIK